MRVTICYYALLREQRGLAEETIESGAENPAKLLDELSAEHGFTLGQDQMRVVINDEFVDWTRPLSDGDTVVFIPPVAGG